MVQKSITKQISNVVLTTTRKALSQQISLSIVLVMGMGILTTLTTTMKPRLAFLTLEFMGQLSDSALAAVVGSGREEH